ncbi:MULTISPECIES: cell division protein ZapA [Roseinatronobacter]|uniref:Cell division protein ZapA n=1 Tax=Roseinatronobacter domitianus TaxID=2940293 RepID=A0ABT0LZX7_9RHOB|nr:MULTISPECIES: cell division protein ZapA [Roseibaca]MCL1628172.1 cell division protein ZapA [Roseibaca domitiana]
MPEQTITIGHKDFAVACQPGEEKFLLAAAEMLDAEARTLLNQIGRVPAEKMLLMSGLMLADKTASVEDKLKEAEAQIESMREEISRLHARPAQKVEVPVVPQDLTDGLSELAARAEAVAEEMESRGSA